MHYFFFILLLLVIFLMPIPLKINFNFKNFNYDLNVFNIKISINKIINLVDRKSNKNDANKKNKSSFADVYTIFSLAAYIDEMKYKPTLNLGLYCSFGIIDAYKTAMVYGCVNSLSPFIYKFMSIPFNIKKYAYKITPNFQSTTFEIHINSIISASIVKIIYMLIFIKIKLRKLKK